MFINLPVTYFYDDNSAELDEVDLNPAHIVSISRDPDDKTFCIVTDAYGDCWNVRLSRQQLRNKIKAHLRANILSLYSKDNNG